MKTTLYKLFLIAALFPALAFCNNGPRGKHTEEKKISKEFNVSANSNLTIDNSYGSIDISTWDQNKVSIQVIIKTSGNDEEAVKKKLDDITVDFSQTSSGVSAKTRYSKSNKSWWSELFGSSNNVNMEINYIVKAPARNNMDISNDYGSIFIDKLLGNSRISCDYGKLDIGELRGNSNHLSFDYTRKSHIGYVKNAEISADYSEYVIEDAERLDVNADYTDSRIMKVELLKFSCDYGSLEVDKVKKITGSGDYLSTKIGRVYNSLDVSVDYGALSIQKIMKGASEIKVSSDYAGVKVGYDPEMDFSFNVHTSYADVDGMEDLEVQKRHQQSTDKDFEGYYRNANSGSSIHINSSYGSVSFEKQ